MGLLKRAPQGPNETRAKALAWVNCRRLSNGREEIKDFPQGVPNSAIKCPISLAFEDMFGVGLVLTSPAYLRRVSDQTILMKLPKHVTAFVADFDARLHPDLVKDTPEPINPRLTYVPEGWVENFYTIGRCA